MRRIVKIEGFGPVSIGGKTSRTEVNDPTYGRFTSFIGADEIEFRIPAEADENAVVVVIGNSRIRSGGGLNDSQVEASRRLMLTDFAANPVTVLVGRGHQHTLRKL